jgi:hypothetical protein
LLSLAEMLIDIGRLALARSQRLNSCETRRHATQDHHDGFDYVAIVTRNVPLA